MKVLCISAANTKSMAENSTSIKVCELIKDIIEKEDITVSILPLVNYDLKSCILCGECFHNQKCIFDSEFNDIFERINDCDTLFLVVPHYSPIPSKLLMVFEKINEILYASCVNNPLYNSPIKKIKVGIIGHGGMIENEGVLKYYHDSLVTPIANTMRSLSFQVIGNEQYPNGVVFGLKNKDAIRKNANQVFPDIIQDYDLIKNKITPFIKTVINQ